MNTVKCFSLLIAGTLLSTALFAQNAAPKPIKEVAAEIDMKPVTAKPLTNTVPAPGTAVVPSQPQGAVMPEQLQPQKAIPITDVKITDAKEREVMLQNVKAIALPTVDAMQAKMTDEMKATMAGKTVRPQSIDQTTGAKEAKLTPALLVKPLVAPVAATPIKEN